MFDPYEKWLGIPKGQRPVDYFHLLGVDPKEKDPEAIRAAAKKRAARLTPHKAGPHGQACARLLKEISKAQDILLVPATRKSYEAQLRKIADDEEVEVVEEVEEADEVEEVEEAEEAAPARRAADKGKKKGTGKSSKKSRQSQQTGQAWLWLSLGGAALLLLLLGGGLTFWLTRTKKETAAQPGPVAAAPRMQSPVVTPPPQPETPATKPPEKAPDPPPQPIKPPAPVAPPPPPAAALSRPTVRKPKPPVAKLPVPDQAAQDKAEKAIKETYAADYAKKKAEDHLALAVKLLQPGRENRSDPAAWFVLLREAREASVRAEKPRLVVEAIDEIDKWFIIDAFAMKLQFLNAMVQAGNEELARAATKTLLSQVEEALAADNHEAALRLVDAAEAAARKGKLDKLLTDIATTRREVKAAQDTYKAVAAAREKIKQAPNDAGANLALGRHLCFLRGHWDEGLPLLAKGGTDEAVLAKKDLTPPANIKAQINAGDGWWMLGKQVLGREQKNILERAFAWYELVQPVAPAEDKARMTERMEDLLRIRAARIPRLVPGSFYGRAPEDKILLLREGGGNVRTEEAVQRGLDWLAAHQMPVAGGAGMWPMHAFHGGKKCNCSEPGQQFDVGGTAFGLLPFLGAGETPRRGRHKQVVLRGLAYLLSQQKKEGKFSDSMYEHALATIAVCEAYGMTAYGMTKDQRYFLPAQAAVDYIVKAQHPEGSWGYSPGAKGDTSITGWQFTALKAAHFAGLSVPGVTFAQVGPFLDQVADPSGLGYGYNVPGAGRATTSVGLLCREYLGWWPSHPGLVKGMGPIVAPQNFVTKDRPSIYFVFYATQVMHHAGGEGWEQWNPKVRDLLLETQDQGKEQGHEHQKGSWSPRGDDYAMQGGRLMFTSLALLTLEVYYYSIPLNGYGPAVLLD